MRALVVVGSLAALGVGAVAVDADQRDPRPPAAATIVPALGARYTTFEIRYRVPFAIHRADRHVLRVFGPGGLPCRPRPLNPRTNLVGAQDWRERMRVARGGVFEWTIGNWHERSTGFFGWCPGKYRIRHVIQRPIDTRRCRESGHRGAGCHLKLTVARGSFRVKPRSRYVRMPRLVGLDGRYAECKLAFRDLRWRRIRDGVPEPTRADVMHDCYNPASGLEVLSQRPRAGTRLRRGSIVSFSVETGRFTFDPDTDPCCAPPTS